jgi:hypothetical protein
VRVTRSQASSGAICAPPISVACRLIDCQQRRSCDERLAGVTDCLSTSSVFSLRTDSRAL